MPDAPRIAIVHRIPGRIRIRIDGIKPDWERLEHDLRCHPGIEDFQGSSISGSLVILYRRREIAEAEVVLRIGLSLAVAANLAPVTVERETEAGDLHPEAAVVGALIFLLGVARFIPGLSTKTRLLNMGAALISGGSVVAHTIGELRADGTFHPETLSVVYLLVSLVRGNGYTGAVLSWLAAYGRHFKGRFVEELVIRASPKGNGRGRKKGYNVTLDSGAVRLAKNALVGYVPALIAHAIAGGKPGDEGFLSDFRNVSERHGYMLEGLEGMADGITMNIRS